MTQWSWTQPRWRGRVSPNELHKRLWVMFSRQPSLWSAAYGLPAKPTIWQTSLLSLSPSLFIAHTGLDAALWMFLTETTSKSVLFLYQPSLGLRTRPIWTGTNTLLRRGQTTVVPFKHAPVLTFPRVVCVSPQCLDIPRWVRACTFLSTRACVYCTFFFFARLLFSSDKLTLELYARGHMFSMGVSGSTLNSLSQTWGIRARARVYWELDYLMFQGIC